MDKLPWAKYFFSLWIVAIVVAMVAKFLTPNPLVLVPFAIGLYVLSVRGISRVKGY